MLLAADVHYFGDAAVAAGVSFERWEDGEVVEELVMNVPPAAGYRPGEFYKRELPCLLALLDRLSFLPRCIVIDGHVYLDASRRPGLGRHLYDVLEGRAAVIGVAKNPFKSTPCDAAVFRGRSRRPLYVTAAGMDEAEARRCIGHMHGLWRIPTLLKRADQLCRKKG